MRNNTPSYNHYRQEYETAKALGSPALACNAVLIPEGYENLRLLIKNFSIPVASATGFADVDYAGGLQSHVAGVKKTSFEGSVSFIETETGMFAKFAQAVADNGSTLDSCQIIFGASDGASNNGVMVYKIFDVGLRFDNGGDIDASSREQILEVQGDIRYMYFGQNANLGTAGANAFANALTGVANGGGTGALANLIGMATNALGNASNGVSVGTVGINGSRITW